MLYQPAWLPLLEEALRWRMHRPDVPFLLGTWGPQTLNACLDQIAQVKIGGTANPRVVSAIRKVIGDAATQDRDSPADIGIAVGAVTIVDRDGKAARETARREAALYLNIIARLDPTLGIEPDLLSQIHDASARYDFEQVARYISDDILRRVAFAGTLDEVAEQAAHLFDAGVQRVEFGTRATWFFQMKNMN